MSSAPIPEGVPPGAPVVPQGPVPAVGIPNSQDYPRLVYTAPRFEVVAIADIIEPSVLEACEALLPTLVPPYVNQAAIDAVNATAVRRAGDTMTGPLNLSPVIPTANAMAASKQYVDTMIATGAVPEVPPVPSGQAWARETGQWVPIAGGGTVTNIATGAGLTGGPITATGTIAMANMNGNTLKGNNTGSVAAPTDIPAGTVLTMIGGAPLNSPAFTGNPSLPTGTQAVTQPGGTSDTTVATTAFVANLVTVYAPLASPVFTGAPSLPAGSFGVTQTAGTSNTSLATTAFVGAALGSYLPLTGGTLAGPGNLTVRGGILGGAAGTVPAAGALTLNANTVNPAPAPTYTGTALRAVGADNVNSVASFEVYGTGNLAAFTGVHARGTAAAPTAVQSGDVLCRVQGIGYTGAGLTGNQSIDFIANENWGSSAQGSRINLITTPNGTTSGVSSLTLAGNTATFSGTATLQGVTGGGNVLTMSNPSGDTYQLMGTSGRQWRIGIQGPSSGSPNFFVIWDQTTSTPRFEIDTGGLTYNTSGTWSTISDTRAKTNIQPYAAGLTEICALDPITYDLALEGLDGTGLVGFAAEQVQAVMPELTGTRSHRVDEQDIELLTIAPTGVVFALVNAIKELKTEIDALRAGRTA